MIDGLRQLGKTIFLTTHYMDEAEALAAMPSALGESGKLIIESEHVMPTLRALSGWAIEHRYDIPDLLVRRPTLEDVYLGLTEPPK